MTDDNKTGAREFWIRHESILPGYGCKEKHAYESEQSNSCHVIEYSAFEQRGQELLKANLANQKLQGRVAELEKDVSLARSGCWACEDVAKQNKEQCDRLNELLEQANKLEEALNIVSVRTEVDHNLLSEFAKDNAIKRCKEVCNKALTQFAEWKERNK